MCPPPPSCRLCLAETPQQPLLFLLEAHEQGRRYAEVLHLETSLQDASLQPQHVCGQCSAVLETFLTLQGTAARSERFLLRHQQLVRSQGLAAAKLEAACFREDTSLQDHEGEVADLDTSLEEGQGFSTEAGGGQEDLLVLEKEDQERLVCPACGQHFLGANRLKKHMLCHDQARLECPKCPGKTFAKSTFVNHMREVHRVGKHISCSRLNCNVKFRKKGDMVRHIAIVHDNKKELCTECGDSFKNLKYHQTTVHQGLRYKCKDCDKEYRTQKMLKQHAENIHQLKRSICDICAVEVIDLKNHMRLNHEGPIARREPCPEPSCSRRFRTLQEARKHHKSFHLEIKEMCVLCGGWFKALYQHMLAVHKAEKKHVCPEPHCEKGFSKKHDLLLHRNRVHLGIKYVCGHCGKQVSKLRDHVKLVHGAGKKEKRAGHKDGQQQQITEEETNTASSSAQINDIIKRCVSNIDETMSHCRLAGLGEAALLLEPGVAADQEPLPDFSVYGQLPGLHAVMEGDTMGGLLEGGRGAKGKELYLEARGQERGEQGGLLGESGDLQEGETGTLQVYQWLPPNI